MPKQVEQIIIYADGGSRGNPGPAAAAFVLADPAGIQLQARGFWLGRTTNNVAEYTAIDKALGAAKQIGAKQVVVFSDSELVVRQVNGEYKVKSEKLRPLFQRTVSLLGEFENWKVQYISRDENKEADKLVNQVLNLGRDVEGKESSSKPNKRAIRLGVLISGGGTTLMNILEYIKQAPLEGWYPQNSPLSSPAKRQAFLTGQGQLNAEVAVVISSRSAVAGVERAKAAGLNVKIIRKKDFPDIDLFSRKIEEELVAVNVDLIIQAGWLCLWEIPTRYENRVMNIHPALLPGFGGKGMWGHHVHEAVLKAGCKVSGCTVHFCTNEYDKGPIILQRTCQVKDGDTDETLAARVFEQECIAYPQAIKLFAEGKIRIRKNDPFDFAQGHPERLQGVEG